MSFFLTLSGYDLTHQLSPLPLLNCFLGQLSGETYACALGDIYTFGPTFRAENSQTTRHLAEFNMIEPEMAFADLFQAMTNAEQFVKYVIKYTLGACVEDMKFFEKFMDKELMARLLKVVDEPFVRLPYREAVVLLQEEIAKDPSKWKYPEMKFGTDFSTGQTACHALS